MCYTSCCEKVYAVFPTKDMRGDLAMDQLKLNGIEFECIIGDMPEERENEQRLLVDVALTSTSRTRRIRTALTTLWTTRS